MDLKDIKAIIDLMKKNSISEFELERQEFKIKLKRGAMGASGEDYPSQVYMPTMAALPAPGGYANQAASPAGPVAPPVSNEIEINLRDIHLDDDNDYLQIVVGKEEDGVKG